MTLIIYDYKGNPVDLQDLNQLIAFKLWGSQALYEVQERLNNGLNPFLFNWVHHFSELNLEDYDSIMNVWRIKEEQFKEDFYAPYLSLKKITTWLRYRDYQIQINHE